MEHKFIKKWNVRFSSLLCLAFIWLLTACGPKTEYRRNESDNKKSFEIKTEDGKRFWGLVASITNINTRERDRNLTFEKDSIY